MKSGRQIPLLKILSMINLHNVIWLTGMSGSGKSTLSSELMLLLLQKNYKVYVLDGDDMRGKDTIKLGYGYKDVMKNNLRVADLCNELRKEYDFIIVPVISPYESIRQKVRSKLEPNFHLVYIKSDIESLRSRDPKGLYLASDKGLINNLIGYSKINPYDEPNNAEVVVETGSHVTISDSREQLFGYINKTCLIV
jgi:adenylylsulfate kinase